MVFDDITSKSREQRIITKEHIALYSSTLMIKVVYKAVLS